MIAQLTINLPIEKTDHSTTVCLGTLHRGIRIRNQIGGAFGVRRKERNPNASIDPKLVTFDFSLLGECALDLRRKVLRAAPHWNFAYQAKLISAHAGDECPLSDAGQMLRDLAQNGIANKSSKQ